MNKLERINKVLAEINEAEEQSLIDNIDVLDWAFDGIENDQLLDAFVRNFKETGVVCIYNFNNDYESDIAKDIIRDLGEDKVAELLRKHSYVKQDYDMYHEHWNDLASHQLDEYEAQIDLDDSHPDFALLVEASEFKSTDFDYWSSVQHYDSAYVTITTLVSLGMVRLKIDVEQFELEVAKLLKTRANLKLAE